MVSVPKLPRFSLEEFVLVIRTDTPEFAYYVARRFPGAEVYVDGDRVEVRIPFVGELYSPVDKLVSEQLKEFREAVKKALDDYKRDLEIERALEDIPVIL